MTHETVKHVFLGRDLTITTKVMDVKPGPFDDFRDMERVFVTLDDDPNEDLVVYVRRVQGGYIGYLNVDNSLDVSPSATPGDAAAAFVLRLLDRDVLEKQKR